jgi:transcriptional regulator with XRE-family HTH domain
MKLHERIEAERKRSGFSQKDLGKASGVTQEAMFKILNGTTKDPKKIVEMAVALNVGARWLKLGDKYPKFPDGSVSEPVTTYNQHSLDEARLAWTLEVMDRVVSRSLDKSSDAQYDTKAAIFAAAWREAGRDPQIYCLQRPNP